MGNAACCATSQRNCGSGKSRADQIKNFSEKLRKQRERHYLESQPSLGTAFR